jgi:hypothetical protein
MQKKNLSLLTIFFLLFLTTTSCNFGGTNDNANQSTIKPAVVYTTDEKFNYKVFIDNSGSMDNFTPINKKKTTNYQHFLSSFLQHIYEPKNNSYNFYTFNSEIDTVSKPFQHRSDIDLFVNELTAGKLKEGNKNHTELEDILRNIIDGLNKSDITIIVSDFKFDGKNANEKNTLKDQIAGHLGDKLKEYDYTTLVIKSHSEWNTDLNKPYYIMLIGNENKVNDILLYLQHNDYNKLGFDDFYKLSSPNKDINAAIKTSNDYYDIPDAPTALTIENTKVSDHSFKCYFRINMSSVPYSDQYLDDPNNYSCPGYNVEIKKDQNPYTHLVTLKANQVIKGVVNFGLMNKNIDSLTSTNNNTDMPALFVAMSEVYKQHYKSNLYFSKTITIK